jgi:hypothetical protein
MPMDKVARLPEADRRDLFEASAARRGLHPAVMEKDFWVCWALGRLFSTPGLSEHLVFKGGTALAKVDGIIERFSEDIDLVLDWGVLGYGEKNIDPWAPQSSNSRLDKLGREMNAEAARYLDSTLCPLLNACMGDVAGVRASVSTREPLSVNIRYPELLEDVLRFKQRFYRSAWAKYETARPGSFRLLPNGSVEQALREDYRGMRPMFFAEPPPWESILKELGSLENMMNDKAIS